MSHPKKLVLVIGAAGAQGVPVVQGMLVSTESLSLKIHRILTPIALSKTGRYNIRAFTRNSTSENAKLLASLPNVSLFLGSARSEPDLRNALNGVDLAFVNTNSFALGIKGETHWGNPYLRACHPSRRQALYLV
jgi:hypothetical protein